MLIKKLVLVLITLLIANTTWADIYFKEEKTINFVITPAIAYRYDVFRWSIPDNIFPNKKLSELIWKNRIIQPSIKIELEPQQNQFTLLGQAKYGYILKTQSKSWDKDWHIYKKKSGGLKSDFYSNTLSFVKGNILDLSGAIGYSVNLFKNNLLTFYIGYDYNDYRNNQYGIRQLVNNRNDLLYPSNKLISKYNFKTQSPWIGLSVKTQLTDKFGVTPTIKYYSFKYVGKGYWLLRYDLKQDPSFKHTAKGYGLGVDLDFLYKYSNSLDFKFNLETKKFKMKKGTDTTFNSKKSIKGEYVDKGKLFDLSLITSSISCGVRYKL